MSAPSFTEFLAADHTAFGNRRAAPKCFAPNLQHKPRYLNCAVPVSNQKLLMAEITLSFKHRRNQIIFEETEYSIYVSSPSKHRGSNHLHRANKSSSRLGLQLAPKTGNPAKQTLPPRVLWQAIRNTSLASQFRSLIALGNLPLTLQIR